MKSLPFRSGYSEESAQALWYSDYTDKVLTKCDKVLIVEYGGMSRLSVYK